MISLQNLKAYAPLVAAVAYLIYAAFSQQPGLIPQAVAGLLRAGLPIRIGGPRKD